MQKLVTIFIALNVMLFHSGDNIFKNLYRFPRYGTLNSDND